MPTTVLYVITILLGLIFSVLTVWYQHAYVSESKQKLTVSLGSHKLLLGFLTAAFIGMAVMEVCTQSARNLRTDTLIQNLVLWYLVFCAAVIDFRVKKLPTRLILTMFAIRLVFILWGMLAEKDSIYTLISSLVAMAIGGGIILISIFISKGKVGAGDMRLYAFIGFGFGLTGLVQVMIYSMFLAALVGVILLIFRKADKSSEMPMGPFILIGLTLYNIFLFNME
ncbi:MAG: A24 family peptidase [Oscillospiraceae bacterium]|nr:A24 family peptidase [Oscillospiraceae bacterium]